MANVDDINSKARLLLSKITATAIQRFILVPAATINLIKPKIFTGLLWHLIFGFQLGQILNEERLQKEISFLEKSLKFKAVNVKEEEAMNGFQFVGECKRQELQYDAST